MNPTRLLTAMTIACLAAGCENVPPTAIEARAATTTSTATAEIASASAAKPADESLTIDFDHSDTNLSDTATAQLDGAARLYRDAKPEVMIVTGHSDKLGKEYPNLILSARRAQMVKQGLVDRGIPPERLQMVAAGQAEPDPKKLASRSVVVTWR